ncbi:MAG: aminotransferase class I/II-fold pyridoxal phosphate-dependent enzyme [archaeon]|nr:aminotransferase class I/II-fold pyridoxal phosphate-dependent enzyme [archaeon]MDA0842382.1 aminotransferase class I/II-fold pyridoxal phosphate-dependent enzyme [archaeon]MDA1167938.1 aminotransferase class I/II-fold pyridoxal phosphate-dependent enzyme [archaeon]
MGEINVVDAPAQVMASEKEMLFLSDHAVSKKGNDTIFGCYARYLQAAESGADAVNGTVGALLTDSGRLAVNTIVIDEIRNADEMEFASYAPLKGIPAFLDLSKSLALGESREQLESLGIHMTSIATPGGSGSLHIAAKCFANPGEKVLLRDRHWGPYTGFLDGCGLKMETYPLLPSQDHDDFPFFDHLSFEQAVVKLANEQHHVMTWLNDPAHNPTGLSLPSESRIELLNIFMRQAVNHSKVGFTLLIDSAYHFYAQETHGWANTIVEALQSGMMWPENLVICFALSISKSHTIYGMRNGALICLHPEEEIVSRLHDVFGVTGRQAWSASPRVSQHALCNLHADAQKSLVWRESLDEFHALLHERRDSFLQACQQYHVPINPTHDGFFAWLETDRPSEIVEACASKHVYLVPLDGGVRIGLCAIPTHHIERVAKVISEAIFETKGSV